MRLGRVEVTSGFLLLAAVLYYFDRDGVLLWSLFACACHELGHYAVIRLLGGQVALLRLSVSGAEMRLSARRPMGHGGQFLSALAGPGTNLLLALILARMGGRLGETGYLLTGLNVALAAFNLLPARQLDGGRALYHLAAMLWSEETGEQVLGAVSAVTAAALLAAGAAVLWLTGKNFTLLLTAAWLISSLRQNLYGYS